MKKIIIALLLTTISISAQAKDKKKRSPANILVTVQGVLAEVDAKKVKIKADDGRVYYVPRQRIDLDNREIKQAVGQAKVSARMTLQELSTLNPFVHY